MPRILIALLALLSLTTSAARSDTPPNPTADNDALFHQAHSESRLLRSHATASPAHLTPVALSCCTVCSIGKACGNT
jgi:hypothetical protein